MPVDKRMSIQPKNRLILVNEENEEKEEKEEAIFPIEWKLSQCAFRKVIKKQINSTHSYEHIRRMLEEGLLPVFCLLEHFVVGSM